MDQNSTNGTDKRNWRERLGIGAKEMPRISEEFNPATDAPVAEAPKVSAAPPVKPAPMAPRAAFRPPVTVTAPRPAAARPAAPIDSDALANKLKSQREAAEKLAEQRVQAARQRAESINVAPIAAPAAAAAAPVVAKPKFTFADDEAKSQPAMSQSGRVPQVSPPQQQVRPSVPQPQSAQQPQMAPPRPQLGSAVPPRIPNTSFQVRPQSQQPLQPPPASYQPPYNPNLGYRPVDPNTGYAPPTQYVPNPGFAPQPRQQGGFTQQPPRLQVPPRVPQPGDYGYGQDPRPNQRINNPGMRAPVQPQYGEADPDDIFEQPAPRMQRRATANDYQQAYREAETGYEEEGQKSRGPLILLLLLALALIVGFGSVWAYNNFVKPQSATTAVGDVPVVKAPDTPAKVSGDNAATAADPQAGTTVAPSKKQIYDRIVGDREVLGGQIVPTEETPVQPAGNIQPIPAPDAPTAPATGTNDDGTPLPLPPPPGGTGQQGSLEPSAKGDQQDATISPAAGASQAAVAPSEPADTQNKLADTATSAATPAKPIVEAAIPDAPVPGEQIADQPAKPVVQESVLAPVKKIALPKADATKVADTKTMKSLGSKPVVLVAPSKKIVSNAKPVVLAAPETQVADSGGLYGDNAVVVDAPSTEVVAPVKKRKSLFDLFKNSSQAPAEVATAITAPPVVAPAPQQVALAQKAPTVSTSNAYVAQLASFKSKAEATQEYRNLSAKHGAIITRYAPIITEAQVAGATRYRLSIGPMASSDVAGGVCQSLFAAGERDCLVHRQ